MIKIVIPYEPVSVNGLYAVSRGRKVKTHKGSMYAQQVYHICQNLKISKDELLRVKIEVYSKWWNKNGTLKKKDIANYEKAMVDAIFANVEADDSQIIEFEMVKVNSEKFYSIVYIELLDKDHTFIKTKTEGLNTK